MTPERVGPLIETATGQASGVARVVDLVRTALARQAAPTLALSGGRTPEAYLPALAAAPDWCAQRITLADERWVSPDAAPSNEALVHRALLDRLPAARRPEFVPFWQAGLDVDAGARAFATRWGARPPDVLVLGMGEDGHIASLFPGSPALVSAAPLCVGVRDGPPPAALRLTLSPRAILGAPFVLVVIAGATKAALAARALTTDDPTRWPIALLARRPADRTHIIVLPEVP